LKQMPTAAMTHIEVHGIAGQKSAHDAGHRNRSASDQQMEMIAAIKAHSKPNLNALLHGRFIVLYSPGVDMIVRFIMVELISPVLLV
jgi:hypothetical protein